MLLKLSWRNIWRNKRRSMVVLTSVIVGVVAALVLDAIQSGMINQMLFNQIKLSASHIQIHKKGFADNKKVQSFIPYPVLVEKELKNDEEIKYYSKRVIAFGLVSSADNSSGIYLNGIQPEKEKNISSVSESIIDGNYFTGAEREIVMGQKLAEKLKVGIGDKVVVMSNTPDGSIGSEVFRLTGIFRTASSEFDKSQIFIPIGISQKMLSIGDNFHEFAIITQNVKLAGQEAAEISKDIDGKYEVLPYTEILPLLVMQIDMYRQMAVIINLIIALALVFGIINSMLMAVYERIQEIGVLMAIGMKNGKIFLMIIFEALIIGIIGTLSGLISGYLIYKLVLIHGIDLSSFTESLSSWGIGAVLYPSLSIDNLIQLLLLIPVVSVLGAIYPAIKAIKLQPVTAIRYV